MVTKVYKTTFLITILMFLGHQEVLCQDKKILELAENYSLALRVYESLSGRRSAENVLRKGKLVGDKLNEMEDLEPADYALLEKKMRGFTLNREEVLFVEPDPKFFIKLTRRKGISADIAFFNLLQKIKPDGVWPAYIEQETDYGGCTIFGNGLLTQLYGRLARYSRAFPFAYRREIKDETYEILAKFDRNVSPCESHGSVRNEFNIFFRTFPKDKNIREMRTRVTK